MTKIRPVLLATVALPLLGIVSGAEAAADANSAGYWEARLLEDWMHLKKFIQNNDPASSQARLMQQPQTAPAVIPRTLSTSSVPTALVAPRSTALQPCPVSAPDGPVAISPGSGSFKDAAGNTYRIDAQGNVTENGIAVYDGSNTALMEKVGDQIYGQDATDHRWFTWNQSVWTVKPAPPAPSTLVAASPQISPSALSILSDIPQQPAPVSANAAPTPIDPLAVLVTHPPAGATTAADQAAAQQAADQSSASIAAAQLSVQQAQATAQAAAAALPASTTTDTQATTLATVFSDNFANSIDPNKWAVNYPWGVNNSDATQYASYTTSTTDSNVFSTGKNGLGIAIKSDNSTGKPAITGQLHSTQAYQYGYFEMKGSCPTTTGTGCAFWMIPQSGAWPPEIDVVESLGANGGNTSYQTLHNPTGGSPTNDQVANGSSSGVHTWGVDWGPVNTTFYMDGKQTKTFPTSDSMKQPMYMILSVNSSPPGNTNWGQSVTGAPINDSFNVQDVKVFATNPYTGS